MARLPAQKCPLLSNVSSLYPSGIVFALILPFVWINHFLFHLLMEICGPTPTQFFFILYKVFMCNISKFSVRR